MMKIQLLDKIKHKGKEYLGGDVIEVSNVDGKKLVKENKAKLISATQRKRTFKKMKTGEIVEDKKLGATFVFDRDDLENVEKLSLDVMTFKAVYKTYLAINRFCLENSIDKFYLVIADNNILHHTKELKTLADNMASSPEVKEDLHNFFETL